MLVNLGQSNLHHLFVRGQETPCGSHWSLITWNNSVINDPFPFEFSLSATTAFQILSNDIIVSTEVRIPGTGCFLPFFSGHGKIMPDLTTSPTDTTFQIMQAYSTKNFLEKRDHVNIIYEK